MPDEPALDPATHDNDLIVAHSSDLHIGARTRPGRELHTLQAVLEAALEAEAQALILAGDIFDSHRTAPDVIEGAAGMLAGAGLPIVILPGNHDPATPDAIYRRNGISHADNVHIFGVTSADAVLLHDLQLEVAGVAHLEYADMPPLPEPRQWSMRWRIVVAHGHWVTGPHDAHRGWLIHDEDLAATGAHYVALGHWDVPQPAGDGRVPAYYSGSPELARTINIVRLGADGVTVTRYPLRLED